MYRRGYRFAEDGAVVLRDYASIRHDNDSPVALCAHKASKSLTELDHSLRNHVIAKRTAALLLNAFAPRLYDGLSLLWKRQTRQHNA